MKTRAQRKELPASTAMSARHRSRNGGAFLRLLVFLIVAGVLLMLIKEVAHEVLTPPYSYTATNNAVTITPYAGLADFIGGDVNLPGKLDGMPVTAIGDNAFAERRTLTGMMIPDSITCIGTAAFSNCTRLGSIMIGSGVTNIGDSAFQGCVNLTSIAIPDNVTSIGAMAFADCTNLTDVALGNGVVTIGTKAFAGCINLPRISIPRSVTNIGDWAFLDCTNLASFCIEGNSPIPSRVFGNGSTTTVYYLPGNKGWGPTFGKHQSAKWTLPPEHTNATP
jgi:hypothetical protein